ncbi:MAG: superoxide dismutase [Candidatus Burarchaeum sp.]|nr:superoxide dismutase [Candidatus Burarchaeum sp.]MDO8340030.1 superoxide dismutase [Candidatus Burarchaeum sp.]
MPDVYVLPDLPYAYNALEPYMDEATVRLHHDKHHAAYVAGANSALAKLDDARKSGNFDSIRALSTALSFHASGHALHSLFWTVMCPHSESKEPTSGAFLEQVNKDFGSLELLKKQLSAASKAVEGSGWGMLAWEPMAKKLIVLQVENHQKLMVQGAVPMFVLDVWEHAYYIKYQNKRADYVDNFWNIVKWREVEKIFDAAVRV